LSANFGFNQEVMLDGNKWLLYDGYLVMFLIMKFVFTALTLSCPIPGGIFTPTFAIGAVLGQLYVSVLIKALAFFELSSVIQYRGVYSILGAAAMTSSVTRTVSVAMIVLELNGHLSHAVPLMVCVLSSYALSEYLNPCSFFEMLSEFGGLDGKMVEKGQIVIKDFLDVNSDFKKVDYISLNDGTEEEMMAVIKKNMGNLRKMLEFDSEGRPIVRFRYIPIVDNHKKRNLLYMVKLDELIAKVEEYLGPISPSPEQAQERTLNDLKMVRIGTSTKLIHQNLITPDMMENRDALPNAVNPVKFIIMSMRHIAPPVLYSTSPLSYCAAGAANLFYEGEGESRNDECDDPSMIIYWIIESINEEQSSHEHEHEAGCRLIGFIPCSDSFGVDLMLDNYKAGLKKVKEERAQVAKQTYVAVKELVQDKKGREESSQLRHLIGGE